MTLQVFRPQISARKKIKTGKETSVKKTSSLPCPAPTSNTWVAAWKFGENGYEVHRTNGCKQTNMIIYQTSSFDPNKQPSQKRVMQSNIIITHLHPDGTPIKIDKVALDLNNRPHFLDL